MNEANPVVTTNSVVSLREVTKETIRTIVDLRVAESQRHFVASNAVSIAEAYFEPHAWFRALYADETPVGFVMLYVDAQKGIYELWRYMMDERYQGLGFGRQALEQVISHVRTFPNATEFLTSYVPGEGCAGPFYQKLGFVPTDEVNDGEIIMRLDLAQAREQVMG